jgi:hypothetical protein
MLGIFGICRLRQEISPPKRICRLRQEIPQPKKHTPEKTQLSAADASKIAYPPLAAL